MSKVAVNKIVSLDYLLFDKNSDELLDKSDGENLLEFLVGKKNIIPGLESELMGLAQGDDKTVIVEAKDAYGEYDNEALEEISLEQFAGIDLKEGMTLYAKDEAGRSIPAIVDSVGDKNVIMDYNHPLAGKTLKFEVNIADIRDASEEELAMGNPAPKSSGGCCGGGCGSEPQEAEAEATSCCSSEPVANDKSGCCAS